NPGRRRLPRPDDAADRRVAHEAARARRALRGREEHAHAPRRRAGGKRCAACFARGSDGDRVPRVGRRPGRRLEGARRRRAGNSQAAESQAEETTAEPESEPETEAETQTEEEEQ